MPGAGWTDNEVLEWYPNHRQEFRDAVYFAGQGRIWQR